jgi:Domain of unknown function (DUF4190)
MRRITILIYAFLMIVNTAFAVVKSNETQTNKQQMTFTEFVYSSPKEIETKTGKKLNFFQRMGLKMLQKKMQKAMKQQGDNCSKIVMKDGDIIEANIIQISPTEIKYKRCGKPNDPELVIYKKDVLSVKTADGEIIFRNTNNNANTDDSNNNNRDKNYGTDDRNNSNNSNEPKMEGNALAGMICGIMGLVLGFNLIGLAAGVVGIILSIIGMNKIKREPKKYKGKGMALAGLVCGIAACAFFLLVYTGVFVLYY